MKTSKGQISRTGMVSFGDAAISLYEDSIPSAAREGGYAAVKEWELQFKRQVFARIVQTLRRLGWMVAPWDEAKNYKAIQHNHRTCSKGHLRAELALQGRCIQFKMWQGVNTPTRADHGGRYESDKEACMPYVIRLEMERTRRRIRDYLCNVFSGYSFDPEARSIYRKPLALTAMECIQKHYAESSHFKGDNWATYKESIGMSYNLKAKDGPLNHGQRVWVADNKGRMVEGVAYHHINNMWWVWLGKYSYSNKAAFEIYTQKPDNLRVKRNSEQRRKRLEALLATAIKAMDFERAAKLRDILFPKDEPLFLVWHEDHRAYHRTGFRGYTSNIIEAGKFTAAEVKGWGVAPNIVMSMVDENERGVTA